MPSSAREWLDKTKQLLASAPAGQNPELQLKEIITETDPVKKIKACEHFLRTFAKDVDGYQQALKIYKDPAARAARIREITNKTLQRKYCEAWFRDFSPSAEGHALVQEIYDAPREG
jgi:hypothetical protein